MAKGPPSKTTLKVRAFAKMQRLKDEITRHEEAQRQRHTKHQEKMLELTKQFTEAADAYTELTGEVLPVRPPASPE